VLVTLRPDAGEPGSLLRALAGVRSARSTEFAEGTVALRAGAAGGGPDALVFERLGVALLAGDPDQHAALRVARGRVASPVLAIEPEAYLMALGHRDPPASAGGAAAPQPDLQAMTWGVYVTQAWRSPAGGAGVRLAVLDTGFDLGHPDFARRDIVAASFVPGSDVHDRHGHGTHTAGTACGPRTPAGGTRRYGIAPDATLLVGKVLDDAGICEEGWLLAGLDWALRQRADIVSLSLGWHVAPGEGFKQAFEQAGRAALDAGCLVFAAAGNDGRQPVFRPANCPSIFAVGALDDRLRRAAFSCVAMNGAGAELDIAAPGVGVYSSVPMPDAHRVMQGTSMATPHVAGCAALWAEDHGLRGRALWEKLLAWTRPLDEPRSEVGAGMVQAPW
jgi:subtilisin family serine protease